MTQVYLGLDVGGTASRWVACDASGQMLARGSVGGATAHIFNPAERTRLNGAFADVRTAISTAGLEATSLCVGMTGYGAGASEDIRSLAGAALGIDPGAVLAMDDIVLAYAAHFRPGEGHLVSAGTGSIGIHVTAAGDVIRVGGRGILIDDAGSGSWIALQALDRMYRTYDRTGSFAEVGELAEAMFALVGGTEWHDVRQYVYAGDRGRIGALAVAVAKAAQKGDAAALDILGRAGEELAQLARALQGRAGRRPVALIGGVLELHPLIGEVIGQSMDGIDVSFPRIDSAFAAARLLQGQSGREWQSRLARIG